MGHSRFHPGRAGKRRKNAPEKGDFDVKAKALKRIGGRLQDEVIHLGRERLVQCTMLKTQRKEDALVT